MSLTWAILLLPVGLAALVKGADWLVDGAVALAHRLGLSPLIVGLTIVAMGTSAPELAASIAAALTGVGDIAIGNVYGSNIANLALVAGLCAVIRPIAIQRAVLHRDIPLMLAATFVLWPVFQNGSVFRYEAAVLLALFVGIMGYMVFTERKRTLIDRQAMEALSERLEKTTPHIPAKLSISALLVLSGLVCLAIGAHLTVQSASVIGYAAGMSEAVIGLTIIAVGTSLPELMTCLVAAYKGHDDLSVGNLVGSNIFNALLVLGVAGLVKPFSVSSRLADIDFWPMAIISTAFAVFAFTRRRIGHFTGGLLFIGYCLYMAYLLLFNR